MERLSIGWCKRAGAMTPQLNSSGAPNAGRHGENIHEITVT